MMQYSWAATPKLHPKESEQKLNTVTFVAVGFVGGLMVSM